MLGPFATTSHLTPIQQMSLAVLSRAACASMSTTSTSTTTTTTTTRHRGDRYGRMEWAQPVRGAWIYGRKRIETKDGVIAVQRLRTTTPVIRRRSISACLFVRRRAGLFTRETWCPRAAAHERINAYFM